MNRVILQMWEESDKNIGQTPDGCSLHLTSEYHSDYLNKVYSNRANIIPDIYDRVLGDPIEVTVNDVLFSILNRDKSIRLLQHEMNNLIVLNEIEIEND
jgi:hypothetical protein